MNAKVGLRDVEASDLALFFEHQRDPVAAAMVEFSGAAASQPKRSLLSFV
jgi:hypothetical protein